MKSSALDTRGSLSILEDVRSFKEYRSTQSYHEHRGYFIPDIRPLSEPVSATSYNHGRAMENSANFDLDRAGSSSDKAG